MAIKEKFMDNLVNLNLWRAKKTQSQKVEDLFNAYVSMTLKDLIQLTEHLITELKNSEVTELHINRTLALLKVFQANSKEINPDLFNILNDMKVQLKGHLERIGIFNLNTL